jgi:hypothetical protein
MRQSAKKIEKASEATDLVLDIVPLDLKFK